MSQRKLAMEFRIPHWRILLDDPCFCGARGGENGGSKEYVLGTHDEEIARLGLQHRVWRPQALAAWEKAEIGPGAKVLDVGCGPGYVSMDLAKLVGPAGRVIGIDKSERFLRALEAMRRERGLNNITAMAADLDAGEFPKVAADRAWLRWVLSFVREPKQVLGRVAAALEPNGVIVLHEYFDYATWRAAPPLAELEEFVDAVMTSWRATGGEPDIAVSVPGWLEEWGFTLKIAQPIVDIVGRDAPKWAWMRAFLEVGRQRLVDLGYLTAAQAESI